MVIQLVAGERWGNKGQTTIWGNKGQNFTARGWIKRGLSPILGFHSGADLFFMTRQTIVDPRYSGYEVSMSVSGNDPAGQTISSLDLPLSLESIDFGGLTFGLGVIDTVDLSPSFQLSANITNITPVPVPASIFLFLSGLTTILLRKKGRLN